MSDPLYVAEVVCSHCGASVPPRATRCASCGGVLEPSTPAVVSSPVESPAPPPEKPAKVPLQERRWLVICLMLFAALFLGFPYLWKSRAFSRAEKVFWTVVVLMETVVVFWVFYVVMAKSIRDILDAFK